MVSISSIIGIILGLILLFAFQERYFKVIGIIVGVICGLTLFVKEKKKEAPKA